MSFVLKTKDGQYITRPITHPATDAQVRSQLLRLQQEGALTLPQEQESERLLALEARVNGEQQPETLPQLHWQAGMVDENTGATTADAQNMRLICDRICAVTEMRLRFANTAKYKYQTYRYRPDGSFDGYDEEWQTAPEIAVQKGWSVIVKVRDNSYLTWTEERIATFAETVTVQYCPEEGIVNRLRAVSEQMETLSGLEGAVRANANGILALKNTVSSLEDTSGGAALLLQYDDNFFREAEFGEISWETGLDTGTSDRYIRSVGWKQVDGDDALFVMSLPENAVASVYTYRMEGGVYTLESTSPWLYHGATFRPERGKFYRVLFYCADGLTMGQQRVLLSGSVLTELLEAQRQDGGNLLEETLTNAEQIEMEETSAAIDAAQSDPSSALIGFFTDLHLECGTASTDSGRNILRTKKHLTVYNKLAKRHRFDLLVFGGDYLQNSTQTVKANAVHSLGLMRDLLKRVDASAPMAVIKGNHDDNTMHTDYLNGYVSDMERWKLLQSADENRTVRDVLGLQKGYGYYDIPNRKIRVFYLNSADVPTALDPQTNAISWPAQNLTGFSREQIQFVADHLRFDEAGWQVLFFSHHAIKRNPFPAPMANVGVKETNGGSVMEQVLQGFRNGQSGAIENTAQDFAYTVSFDFTANRSNTIIACVSGHTHYDCHAYLDGINWIATRAIDGHSTYQLGDTSVYLVVNRKDRILTLIANGDGEDRSYVY